MKRNCTTTSNSWFLFFVTEKDSFGVLDDQPTENIAAELITSFSINEDDDSDKSDSPESSEEDDEGFTDRGVDPARTRGVDPARTRAVDPARTRGVDPARTRGEE